MFYDDRVVEHSNVPEEPASVSLEYEDSLDGFPKIWRTSAVDEDTVKFGAVCEDSGYVITPGHYVYR